MFWHEFISEIKIGWPVFIHGPEFWVAFPAVLGLILAAHVWRNKK